MEENKELTMVLQRLEANSIRQAKLAKWQCVFSAGAALLCAAALICILCMLPRIGAILRQADAVMTDIQQVSSQLALADWEGVISNLEQVSGQMAGANLGSIVEEVNGLVKSSQIGLEQTMDKLNSIDFDTLNQAIGDLARVVEPLAKLFGRN